MTAEPINLPKALVIEKAREAYLAGRLSAQGPTPDCRYRDKSGLPCVISAAVSNLEAERMESPLMRGTSVQSLVRARVIETDDEVFLLTLQIAHDDWAHGEEGREAIVCEMLGITTADLVAGDLALAATKISSQALLRNKINPVSGQ